MAHINQLYIKAKQNSKDIQMVTLGFVPLSKLYYEEEVNRDEYTSHTETFEDVIQEDNFMDTVKVFPEDSEGRFKIAEATHRVRALKNIFQDEDPEVPIAILDWKDGEDEEDVKTTVIRFNNTGRSWNLYDYVKVHSNTNYFTKEVGNLWNEIFGKMKSLKSLMSNATVIGIYTGQISGHDVVKVENLAKKFRLSSYERQVVDIILARMTNIITTLGKKNVPVLFQRKYVNHMRLESNRLNDINDFEKYFQSTIPSVHASSKVQGLPLDEDSFRNWINTTVQVSKLNAA